MKAKQYQPQGATATDLANDIEAAIRDGRLTPGTPLESIRQVAKRLTISPATASSAYRMLRDRGMVTTRERSKTIVSSRPPIATGFAAPLSPSVRDLSSGNPDPDLLPSLEDAARQIRLPTRLYGEASVLPELRDLARRELEAQGIRAENLAVVSGGLDGIERVLRAHLLPGDRIAIEDPCYTGVLDLVRALGLVPVPVPVDTFGPDPGILDQVLEAGASAFVMTPKCQNPTGAALTMDRGAEIRDVLANYPGVLVIEDDHAGETSNVARVSVTEGSDRWAVSHSLAKSLGPDLRIAILTGDPLTISRVEGRQLLGPGWVSHILQRLVLSLWRNPQVRKDLAQAASVYDERRRAMVQAMAEHGIPTVGRSGWNAWIPLAAETPITQGLLQMGWAVRSGEVYRLDSGPGIRVTTATLTPDESLRFAEDLSQLISSRDRTRRA